MPPKHIARERAWGTRYDSLKVSSPPPSPPTQRLPASTSSSIPYSPSSPHRHDASPISPHAAMPTPTKSEKTSHDSSIFIGSLPSNMDHNELTRLLNEHFSNYPDIRSVKVVRDSKGGVCAFAQCENATSAGRLLQELQMSSQRPFLGRTLRFEPARAYRTLLISYRVPQSLPYPNSDLEPFNSNDSRVDDGATLHTAMRLFKPRNNKYCMVVYDSEAIDFETRHSSQTSSDDTEDSNDPLGGAGLLISPLKCDEQTLRKIAEAFGTVEHFGPFVPKSEGPKDIPNVRPHDAPRSAEMDGNIWEIKWEQRESCMNASMTLRNIPHLIVTWAHRAYHETGSGLESRFGSPTVASSPWLSSNPRSRTQSRSNFVVPGDLHRLVHSGVTPAAGLRILTSPSYIENSAYQQARPIAFTSPTTYTPSSPSTNRALTALAPRPTPVDFPPLRGTHSPRRSQEGFLPPAFAWGYKETPEEDVFAGDPVRSVPSSPSPSVQASTPTPVTTFVSLNPDPDDSEYPYSESPNNDIRGTQELTIPLTPEFSTTSITPTTPKTALSFPYTPQSARSHGDFGPFSRKDRKFSERDDGLTKEVDPLWVFAGGLSTSGPSPWDQDKVRRVFGKYGELVELEFIKPAHSLSGFAFIKYANTTDSAKAVASEHLRSYDGRTIRVQLREMNPSRNAQRYTKSGSRAHRGILSGTHELDHPLHDVHHRHIEPDDDGQQLGAGAAALEEASPPIFPSIAAPEFGIQVATVSDPLAKTAPSIFPQERPTSPASGSASSPPSSIMGAPPTMGPVAPYSIPMHPSSWMHSYPPYPYGPSYGGFVSYHPPMPGYPPGAYATAGDRPAVPQYPWHYPGYPSRTVFRQVPYHQQPPPGPGNDQGQPSSQPPVKPFALLEGDHGIFAMYPQEALNQYMSGIGRTSQSPPSGTPTPVQGAPPVPGWVPYIPGSHAAPMYHYPNVQPLASSTSHRTLAPVYPAGNWIPPTGHTVSYPPPHFQPPHVVPGTQSVTQGPPPPYSASYGTITPSSSYRPSTQSLQSHRSQTDVGQSQPGFHAAGPRRFSKYQGPGSHHVRPHGVTMASAQSQTFRSDTRSESGVGRDGSPPHSERRGSRSLGGSYSLGSDISSHGQGTSGSQQYLG